MITTGISRIESPKFPAIEAIDIEDARRILRSASFRENIGLEQVIQIMDCDAHAADGILRTMAAAGYLSPKADTYLDFSWQRTPTGKRLALEKKRKRIDRTKVDATVAELITRAKTINADPDRLHRITLRLFGSALEDRNDYGDVDIAIKFHERRLPDRDLKRIKANLEERQSDHDRQSFFGRLMGAENQDDREIRAALKKGMPQVSLMSDDPVNLGTPFRWLVDHDMETDRPALVSPEIVRPNTPSRLDQEEKVPVPQITIMKARQREIAPSTKVPTKDLFIGVEDAPYLEAALWTPAVARDGALEPNDVRYDPRVRFAGFQHLCDVWKQPVGGVKMLKLALDWCDEHRVWVRDLFPGVSISRGNRINSVRLGFIDELIYFEVGAHVIKGSLMPINRTRVSKTDLAGAYAVARALVKMYREARCSKMKPFKATLLINSVDLDCLPDFPKLAKAGEFQKDTFAGLLAAKIC
jgi:hypothetical protein